MSFWAICYTHFFWFINYTHFWTATAIVPTNFSDLMIFSLRTTSIYLLLIVAGFSSKRYRNPKKCPMRAELEIREYSLQHFPQDFTKFCISVPFLYSSMHLDFTGICTYVERAYIWTYLLSRSTVYYRGKYMSSPGTQTECDRGDHNTLTLV